MVRSRIALGRGWGFVASWWWCGGGGVPADEAVAVRLQPGGMWELPVAAG